MVGHRDALDTEVEERQRRGADTEPEEVTPRHEPDVRAEDADRDYWLSAKEAKDYGLIDNVLELKRGFKPRSGEDDKIQKSEG